MSIVSLLIYMTFLNRRLRLLKPQLLIFNLRISALKIRTLARLRNLHALLAYLLDGGHATLLKIIAEGQSVAVCDLTRGEMGTLGTPETRRAEAEKAGSHLPLKSEYLHSTTLARQCCCLRRLSE